MSVAVSPPPGAIPKPLRPVVVPERRDDGSESVATAQITEGRRSRRTRTRWIERVFWSP